MSKGYAGANPATHMIMEKKEKEELMIASCAILMLILAIKTENIITLTALSTGIILNGIRKVMIW